MRIETPYGSGSGVIIAVDESGNAIALTNQHVVERVMESSDVQVTVRDDIDFSGTRVVRDTVRDLAVIHFCCDPTLEAVEFASGVELGSTVVAMGYPLGLGSLRITTGTISGIQSNELRDRVEVQTNAALNPGNSGGPLMLLDGTIAGINTYVQRDLSEEVTTEGVGFAIGAETLTRVIPPLLKGTPAQISLPMPHHPDAPEGEFIHQTFQYRLEVPRGWDIQNGQSNAAFFVPVNKREVAVVVRVIETTLEQSGGSAAGYWLRTSRVLEPEWDFYYRAPEAWLVEREPWLNSGSREPYFAVEYTFSYGEKGRFYYGITDLYYTTIDGSPY